MPLPRFQPPNPIAPMAEGPVVYGADSKALHDLWAADHTNASGVEVEYWCVQEHGPISRHPLYREPEVRTFRGPYRFKCHVDLPNAVPEVEEKGFRATWVGNAWLARAVLEAANVPTWPSEGDVIGLWGDSNFYLQNEAQQGDTVKGMRFYFTVLNVGDVNHLYETSTFIGFDLALGRTTNFSPERRIEKRIP